LKKVWSIYDIYLSITVLRNSVLTELRFALPYFKVYSRTKKGLEEFFQTYAPQSPLCALGRFFKGRR
jgi:hypothetical protein